MPPANPHGIALNHFHSSNSTTQHFLGGAQRTWMTGSGGNTASLGSQPPARRIVTSSTSSSAPNPSPTVQSSPAQLPYGTQPAQIDLTHASNPQWAPATIPYSDAARKRSFEAASFQPTAPVASPSQHRQQSHPGVPQANAVAAPSHSSYGPTIDTLSRLTAFQDHMRRAGHLNDLVSYRGSILTDACGCNDHFFLCLHQIFCRATADPLFITQIGFGDEQRRGFNMLQDILSPNNGIPPEDLQFFATFPYPDPTRTSPLPEVLVSQVRAFLSGLGKDWEFLVQICTARGYPPFTDELRVRRRLGSPVCQRIMFSYIHRRLTGANNPVWIEQGMRLFDENQRESQKRLAEKGVFPSEEHVEMEARQLGTQYLSLRSKFQPTGFDPALILGNQSAGGNRGGTQQSSMMGSDTVGSSHSPNIPEQNRVQFWDANTPHPPPFVQQPPVQRQHAAVMQQHHSQVTANASNHIQQAQSRKRGRPPLSHNRQSSRPTASPTTANTPPTTTGQGRALASDRGARVTAIVPPTSRQSPLAGTLYPLFLPLLGQEQSQGLNPNPGIVALHQAHLRSPKYQIANVQGMARPVKRLYQVPTGCILSPQVLHQGCPFFCWQFEVSANDQARKAKDLLFVTDPKNTALAEPIRQVTNGSLLYRLKCIQVPTYALSTSMPEDVWVTRDTVWPHGIFLAINDKQLETRKKLHHGKDLTIDVTKYVKAGLNTVICSLLRTVEEMKAGKNFAVAVEVVEIISDNHIRELPGLLTEADARDIITKSLQSSLYGKSGKPGEATTDGDEEDLVVVDAHLSIDITDPYTARVFEVPVRGKTCLHRECFDLQTFLDTRKARPTEKDRDTAPTNPDEWKCPICKKDARPQNLVVDGFLHEVRKELAKRDQLDVKAIKVQADGKWEPVLDTRTVNRRDSNTTDDADVAASRSRRQSVGEPGPGVTVERWMGGQKPAAAGEAREAWMGPPGQGAIVTIELD